MKWSPVSWRRDSGQSGGGYVAAGFAQNKARGSALVVSFKGDLVVSHPGEEVLLAFGKKFELRQAGQIARPNVRKMCEALCEEATAIAGDFENQVRRHLISAGVVIKERRINTNLGT